MIDLIKEVLAAHPDTNLASEGAVDHIARDIMDKILPEDENDVAKTLFTLSALDLFGRIAQEVHTENTLSQVKDAYDKIAGACGGFSNGITLLALVEALLALMNMAASKVTELQKKPDAI